MNIIKVIDTNYQGSLQECPVCKGHTALIAQDKGWRKYFICLESGCGIFRFSYDDMGQSQITVELVNGLFIELESSVSTK